MMSPVGSDDEDLGLVRFYFLFWYKITDLIQFDLDRQGTRVTKFLFTSFNTSIRSDLHFLNWIFTFFEPNQIRHRSNSGYEIICSPVTIFTYNRRK